MSELNSLGIKWDPLSKYESVSLTALQGACGVVPLWAVDVSFIRLSLKEALEVQYGFGPLIEIRGATVDSNGVMSYPGDPDLYPLVKITRNDETFYMYPHAIVCIVSSDGSCFVTRMD